MQQNNVPRLPYMHAVHEYTCSFDGVTIMLHIQIYLSAYVVTNVGLSTLVSYSAYA